MHIKSLLFILCAFAFTTAYTYQAKFSFNDLYGTELEFLAPGEAKPKERATRLAALIKKHTDPTKSSRSDFLSFMANLEEAHTAAPELINDLYIPGTATERGFSIQGWFESELYYDYDYTNRSIHREDQIARIEELEKSLRKAKTFTHKVKRFFKKAQDAINSNKEATLAVGSLTAYVGILGVLLYAASK